MSKNTKKFIVDEIPYTVKKYKGRKLKKGNAYILDEYVYPYYGKLTKDDINAHRIGVYKNKKGSHTFIHPITDEEKETYSISYVRIIDPNAIDLLIQQEGLMDIDKEVFENEVGDYTIFPITDDDNILQKIIKTAANKKKINIKNYETRFRSQSDMSNAKRALLHHGKMSIEKFNRWCDIFDIDYEIRFTDSPNAKNPMNMDGVASNRSDNIDIIEEGE